MQTRPDILFTPNATSGVVYSTDLEARNYNRMRAELSIQAHREQAELTQMFPASTWKPPLSKGYPVRDAWKRDF